MPAKWPVMEEKGEKTPEPKYVYDAISFASICNLRIIKTNSLESKYICGEIIQS